MKSLTEESQATECYPTQSTTDDPSFNAELLSKLSPTLQVGWKKQNNENENEIPPPPTQTQTQTTSYQEQVENTTSNEMHGNGDNQ